MKKPDYVRLYCTKRSRREGRDHARELGLPENYTVIGVSWPMEVEYCHGIQVLSSIFGRGKRVTRTVEHGTIVSLSPSVPSTWKKRWPYGYIIQIHMEASSDAGIPLGCKGLPEVGLAVKSSVAKNECRALRALVKKHVATVIKKCWEKQFPCKIRR